MQSMLEKLYDCSIRTDTICHGQESAFAQAVRLKQRNLEKLMAALNDSEKELFGKYCDAQGELEEITRYITFQSALKSGILLMSEVYMGKEEITY